MIACTLAVTAASCACGRSAGVRAAEDDMKDFRGTITVAGPGVLDAEVFLLAGDGKVLAATNVDGKGGFALAPPAGFAGGWLLYKLYAPVIGARAVAVTAPGAHDLAIGAADAVALSGRITLPAGAPAGWLDVRLTPRSLDGLPAEAAPALLAAGPEPVRRSSFVTRRIEADTFGYQVMRGSWRLEIERMYVDSGGLANPPVSLELGAVTVDGGPPPEAAPIGFWLDVKAPVAVAATLKVVAVEDL